MRRVLEGTLRTNHVARLDVILILLLALSAVPRAGMYLPPAHTTSHVARVSEQHAKVPSPCARQEKRLGQRHRVGHGVHADDPGLGTSDEENETKVQILSIAPSPR